MEPTQKDINAEVEELRILTKVEELHWPTLEHCFHLISRNSETPTHELAGRYAAQRQIGNLLAIHSGNNGHYLFHSPIHGGMWSTNY